jgi:acyl-CoA synthetase (AMP-forming)/AMP-acid ligase II
MVHAPLESSHWPADGPAHFRSNTDLPGNTDFSGSTASRGSTVSQGSTVGGVLRAAAARVPDRAALVFGDRRWSYADLLAKATDGARALLASFIPGDVVAVWAENCAEWVTLEFAAGLAGLTLVPLNPAARAEEVSYVLAHSGARAIFLGTDPSDSSRPDLLRSVAHHLPALRFVISLGEWDALCAIGSLGPTVPLGPADHGHPGPVGHGRLPEVDPDGPAQILYTAGTTGRPKAALLTHRGLTNNARLAARALGGRDGDVAVNPLPLSHVTGCGLATLGIAQLAGTHVLMTRFDATLALTLAGRHRCGLLYADPAMLPALLAALAAEPAPGSRDLGSLRAVISGGAPLPPELALEAETALGVPALAGLFQTEAGCVITAASPDDTLADRLGGVGRPLPGTEVKITGLRTGETLPCGTVGEIRVRGCQVMRGYLNDPRLTAEMLDGDGWLRTGDLGAMDSRGYCRIVGRAGELIVRGGRNVYPREIEAVLRDHAAVAEAAVVGVPDRFWGGSVAAVVRLARPLEAPALALTEHCGGRLSSHKIPVRWLFVDDFPRTFRGEIRKVALSARLAGAPEPDWRSADLLGAAVPPQARRSKALEDIEY